MYVPYLSQGEYRMSPSFYYYIPDAADVLIDASAEALGRLPGPKLPPFLPVQPSMRGRAGGGIRRAVIRSQIRSLLLDTTGGVPI